MLITTTCRLLHICLNFLSDRVYVCVYIHTRTNGPAEVLKLFLLFVERALLEFGFQYLGFFGFQIQLLLQMTIPVGEN